MLFRARTGVPWPDLPERYGPWQTVYERHRRWSVDGTWQRILSGLQIEADAADPDGALAAAAEGGRAVRAGVGGEHRLHFLPGASARGRGLLPAAA
ncbi:transposase [Streptomyces abikoensis]